MTNDWKTRVAGRTVCAVRQLTSHDASAYRVEMIMRSADPDTVIFESTAPIQVSVIGLQRHESETRLSEWSDAKWTTLMQPEDHAEIRILVHKLWDRDTGPDYNKADWKRLVQTLGRFGYQL